MDTLTRKNLQGLLRKLCQASLVYQKCDNNQKIRLFNSCGKLLDKLVEFGYDRIFAEAILIGGKDFLNSEREATLKDCELVAGSLAEDLTEEEAKHYLEGRKEEKPSVKVAVAEQERLSA